MKYHKNVYKALSLITQFSINMLVPIFGCSFLGMFLDRKLGTGFCMIILFFVGALAGFRNVYRMAATIFKDKGERDKPCGK
ncbi:MAG: AtpZ/AtpI family protein [Lachnospiraceae bacterium]